MRPESRLPELLRARGPLLSGRRCFVGFDGFVDTIVSAVGLRTGPGEAFTPQADIAEFGRRVLEAAGKSTNFELYPRMEKLGGNGPTLAGALLAQGAGVTCVGAFGEGAPHAVFAGLAKGARLVSLCEPARTTAIEFSDGKIMLGMMRSFDGITPAAIAAALGAEAYRDELAAADLVALGNWTMIPGMTEIYGDLTSRVLPSRPVRPGRIFFFDLADPEKRLPADLARALEAISRFEAFGKVTLGLNLKEAHQVLATLGLPPAGTEPAGLRAAAEGIRDRLGLSVVAVHPKESAACATREGSWWIPGPYAGAPLITTGAGDHFNAGFAAGQLMGLDPEACLGLAVHTSGFYVRTARSPSLADLGRSIPETDQFC